MLKGWEESCTYPAHEAFWVPLGVEGRDVILHNGRIAACTFWSKHVVVVLPTVGFPVAFVKALVAESISALSTEEVLRVPRFVQGCYTFLQGEKAKSAWSENRKCVRERVRPMGPRL